MILHAVIKDLRSKISYKGILESSTIQTGSPLMMELTGTSIPVGFQTGPITGWLQDTAVNDKVYLFDAQGGKFLLHFSWN